MEKTKTFILTKTKNINLKVIKVADYVNPDVLVDDKQTRPEQTYTTYSRLIFSADGRKVYDTQNSKNKCKTFRDLWPLGMPQSYLSKIGTVVLKTNKLIDLIEKTDLVETFSKGLRQIVRPTDKDDLTDCDIKSIWKLDDKGRYCQVVGQDEFKNISTYKY